MAQAHCGTAAGTLRQDCGEEVAELRDPICDALRHVTPEFPTPGPVCRAGRAPRRPAASAVGKRRGWRAGGRRPGPLPRIVLGARPLEPPHQVPRPSPVPRPRSGAACFASLTAYHGGSLRSPRCPGAPSGLHLDTGPPPWCGWAGRSDGRLQTEGGTEASCSGQAGRAVRLRRASVGSLRDPPPEGGRGPAGQLGRQTPVLAASSSALPTGSSRRSSACTAAIASSRSSVPFSAARS